MFRSSKSSSLLLSVVTLFSLSGCSVYFAASGSKDPNLERVNRGAERSIVEGELGVPIETKSGAHGEAALYTYKLGDQAAPGRAFLYLLGDIVTFCLAEYIFFPLEISNSGDSHYLRVDYDKNEKVSKVSQVKEIGNTSGLN